MNERRRFNRRGERNDLYIDADGLCAECGRPLEPGWHADHIHPYSKGGATDVVNGQALCPACNLTKGSRTSMTDPRDRWQTEVFDQYINDPKRDFLISACPGAGKTKAALDIAVELERRGRIDFTVVVTPSIALRMQWSDQVGNGLHLLPYDSAGPVKKKGYHGVVVTYSGLRLNSGLLRRNVNSRTLVVLDEIHHAGTGNVWGDRLNHAFENAGYRLALTGTPWRSDPRSPIAFLTYDEDGRVQPDYSYTYGEAVEEKACRLISFPQHGATAEWRRNEETKKRILAFDTELPKVEESDALRTILDTGAGSEWLPSIINEANRQLISIREEFPDAAGLICARNIPHANQCADILKRVTGVRPPVVVSAEDGGNNKKAQEDISRFRDDKDPWIVAVRMISEGVDIPRLAVGVYATNYITPLFFRQFVGRFVRIRDGEKLTGVVYIPPITSLWAYVQELLGEISHQLNDDDGITCFPPTGPEDWTPSDFDALRSEDTGRTGVNVPGLGTPTEEEVLFAEMVCERVGIGIHLAHGIAAVLKESTLSGWQPPAAPVVAEEPLHQREKKLRALLDEQVKKLAAQLLREDGVEYSNIAVGRRAKRINAELARRFGDRRPAVALETLQAQFDCVQDWRERGGFPR